MGKVTETKDKLRITYLWKGNYIKLFDPPSYVTSNYELMHCSAKPIAEELNGKSAKDVVLPSVSLEADLKSRSLVREVLYIAAQEGEPMAYADMMAKCIDGSTLIWFGATKQWGFAYGIESTNNFPYRYKRNSYSSILCACDHNSYDHGSYTNGQYSMKCMKCACEAYAPRLGEETKTVDDSSEAEYLCG
jgi:hypothetical protein